LGDFDARFNISKDEARTAIAEAEAVWETAAGRELFTYQDDATFPIHFIFDDRQERTITEEAERAALDRKEATSAEIATQYAALREQYSTLEVTYKTKTAAYEKKLAAFNARVEKNNQAGGAPAALFAELQYEEKSLQTEAGSLQKLSNQLADIAKSINDLSERGNQIIAQYNAGVNEYNHEFGQPNEFTQGDYQRDKINIYKFSNMLELKKVLVHELGHALGVGHVEGSSSMMYYLMADQPDSLSVSTEDMRAFRLVCEDQLGLAKVPARFVQSFITQFNAL
jgi:uncharacterized phage infection (PIP) family protein YhgE